MKTTNKNKEYNFCSNEQMLIYEAVQYYLKATSSCDSMELDMMKILNKILANNTYGEDNGNKYREALENGEIIMAVNPEEMYDRSYRRKYKWERNPDYDNWETVVSK